MVSGVLAARAGVSRVKRVAKLNSSGRLRAPRCWAWPARDCAPYSTYMSRSRARAYGSIEPEMSHSTTSRRGRTTRAWRDSRMTSPPYRRAWRMVRRRSGRLPCRDPRYRRVRRGGMARVRFRMSRTSWVSSDAVSSVKSRPRSRSAADAARWRAWLSGWSSSSSPEDELASVIRVPVVQPSAVAGGRAADAGELSPPRRGSPAGTGGSWASGDGRPKIAAKTRSKVGIWLGADTMVARAQARSSGRDVAFMTVMARASRSQRSGPTGRPAVCSAAPNAAAVAPTAGAPISVKGGDHRSQPGLAHRLLVLGVLQDRAQGLIGHRHGQFGFTEHADREGPGDGLGDAWRLGQVQGSQPLDRRRDLTGQPLPRGRHPAADDFGHQGRVRVGDPVVQAAALERVVQVPGPVRGQHDHGGQHGVLGAKLGDGDRRL